MKKIFFIVLALISICQLGNSQTSCSTAQFFDSTSVDGIILQQQSSTNKWYKFEALNSTLDLNSFHYKGVSPVLKVNLWSGTCSGLSLIGTDTLSSATDSLLTISTSSLTINQQYYVQFVKANNSDTARYLVDLNFRTPTSGCTASTNNCELICNGDFEQFSSIPTAQNQLSLSIPWQKCNTQTPDNYTSSSPSMGSSNWAGVENSVNYASGDKGYAGLVARWPSPPGIAGDREIIYQQLKCTLKAGVTYHVEMQVSLSDYSKYAVNYLGMYFSIPNPYAAVSGSIVSIPAQTISSGSTYITNTTGWTTISGSYVAVGGENYIAIGCFGGSLLSVTPGMTIPFGTSGNFAYYYIDQVSVTPVNTLTITATPNPVNCGTNTALSNNLGLSLDWSPSAGLSCNNCTNPTTPNLFSNTTYSGTITYCDGCSYTATTTVNVNLPVVNAGGDVTICNGSSTTLNASGATSYSWSPSTGLSNPAISNPVASPTSTTSYTVTGTVGSCSNTDVVVVTVKPKPVLNPVSNVSVCNGATVPASSFSSTPAGAIYAWTNSNTAIGLTASGSGNTPSFTGTNSSYSPISGTISVTPTLAGCVGNPGTFTITVNPTPNVIVPSNLSLCVGTNNPVTTFSSSTAGATFSWTNSNTAIGLAASGTGNLPAFIATNSTGSPISGTITVTPTANGCTGTPSSFIITVYPLPTASATATPSSISLGSTSALSATGGVSYSWLPTTGLSNPSISNPVATPGTTTTYTVTVTDANGCTATATVTVTVTYPECAISIDYDVPDGAYATTYGPFSSPFISVIAGKNIKVEGTLYIDKTLTFSSCNFLMTPDAKIVIVGNKQLTLNEKTHVFSCSSLWDGIYVTTGGNLNISGYCRIEDAKNAVVSSGGGYYFISSSLFNKNYIGVDVQAFSGTHTGKIENTIFTSRWIPSSATPSSNSDIGTYKTNLTSFLPSNLLPPSPYNNQKGGIGVKVTDVNSIQIGLDGLMPISGSTGYVATNTFDEIKCGIQFIRTNGKIYNNNFQNILNPGTCFMCLNYPGYGVYATGTSSGSYTIEVGGTGSIYEPNTFSNCHRAVELNDYSYNDVLGNTIANTTTASESVTGYGRYGVVVKPAAQNTVNVVQNSITNCANGVWVNRTSYGINSVSVDVNSNTITANSSGYCNYGVNITDVTNTGSTTPTDQIKIQNNSITQAYNCVSATNIKNSLVVLSNPVLEVRNNGSTSGNGIYLANCAGAKIHDNEDIHLLPVTSPVTSTNIMYKGVQVYASPSSQITCNKIFNMGESMTFVGSCVSSTLRNNQMTGGNRGFVLRTNGEVGSQGSFMQPCGLWWDPNFTAQTFTDGTTNANTNSRLSVNNSGAPSGHTGVPTSNSIGAGGVAYSFTLGGLNNSIGSPMSCSSIVIEGLAGGGGESMSSSQLLSLATDSTQYPVYSAETQYLNQKLAYDQLDLISESSAIADPQLDLFYQNNQNSAIGQLKTTDKAIAAQDISTADVINNNVIPVNVIDENQKTFNSLFIAGLNDPGYQYAPAELAQLSAIAEQCPSEGGPAVWQSRVLLSTIADDWISFTDPCVQSERMFQPLSQQANNSGLSNAFSLYPNPGNGDITLRYSVNPGEKAVLCIYEMSGKNVGTYNLNSAEKNMQLHLANLQSGVYYYSISINSKIVQTDKLVIIR